MRDLLRGIRFVLRAGFQAAPRLAIFGFTLEPIAAFMQTFAALFLKFVIDGVRTGDASAVTRAAAGLALTTGFGLVLRSVGWRLRTKLLERTGAWLDARILELSSSLPGLELHERAEYHDRLQMLHGSELGNTIFAIVPGTAAFVRIVVTAGLLSTLHPALGLLPVFGVPSVLLGVRAEHVLQETQERITHRWRRSNSFYALTIAPGPAKELRVFGLSDEIRRRHREERDANTDAFASALYRGAVLSAAGWISFAMGYLGAIALVAVQARTGAATIGDVMLAITLAAQLNTSVSEFAGEVQDAWGRMRMTRHYLWLEDLVRSARTRGDAEPPRRLGDGIRFERVSFVYPGTDEVVLQDVDVFLPAGARVAIVGDNGAGKTTLVKLLCGFYQPTAGRITVDGVDLGRFDPTDWRARLAGGFQDYCRFEFLAGETVGLGDLPRIQDEPAIAGALDRAGAADLSERLPAGLATQLGKSFDEGVELSMGQWQKLALGRAFMRTAPLVLMLDEPTSSLDAPTEQALFSRYAAEAERRRADGAITILVSHRFSTVRSADMIVVVEGGRVREVGSHAELMSMDGLYKELFTLQAAAYR